MVHNKKILKKKIGFFCKKITIKTIKEGFGHTIGVMLTNILFNNINGYSLVQINIFKNNYNYNKKNIIELVTNLQIIPIKLKKLNDVINTYICINIGGNNRNFYSFEIKLPLQLLFLLNIKLLTYRNNNLIFTLICFIKNGVGYQNLKIKQVNNLILLNNSYSPIETFNYTVEKTKKRNIETIECIITTKGNIKPSEILQLGSIEIQTQLSYYLNLVTHKYIYILIKNNKLKKTSKCLKIY